MCRSFMIIQNIQNVTIDDLLVYMKRRLRLYVIFFVLQLVTLIFAHKPDTAYIAFGIVTLALYVVSVGAILQLGKNPTSCNALLTLIAALLVMVFNIFSMVYTLVTTGNLFALIALISIVLQISVLFIVHKLREKLIAREQGREEDNVTLEQPIENSSTHSTSDHGRSTNNKNSNQAPDIENPVLGGGGGGKMNR